MQLFHCWDINVRDAEGKINNARNPPCFDFMSSFTYLFFRPYESFPQLPHAAAVDTVADVTLCSHPTLRNRRDLSTRLCVPRLIGGGCTDVQKKRKALGLCLADGIPAVYENMSARRVRGWRSAVIFRAPGPTLPPGFGRVKADFCVPVPVPTAEVDFSCFSWQSLNKHAAITSRARSPVSKAWQIVSFDIIGESKGS